MNTNITEVKEFQSNTIDNSFKGILEKHFGCKCDIEQVVNVYIHSKEKPYEKEMELMKLFPNIGFDFHWIPIGEKE